MTGYVTVPRLQHTLLPTRVVFSDRSPLVSEYRLRTAVAGVGQITLARIDGAAPAVNFSHPAELASVVRLYLNDQEGIDDPSAGGVAEQRTEQEYRHGR